MECGNPLDHVLRRIDSITKHLVMNDTVQRVARATAAGTSARTPTATNLSTMLLTGTSEAVFDDAVKDATEDSVDAGTTPAARMIDWWNSQDLHEFSLWVAGGGRGNELESGFEPMSDYEHTGGLAACLLSPDKEVRARIERTITHYPNLSDEPAPFFLEAVRRGDMNAAWHLRMLGGAVVLSLGTASFAWREAFKNALQVCPLEYLRSSLSAYAELLTPEMLDAAAARPDITPPLRALTRCFASERRLLRLLETAANKADHDRLRGHYDALHHARKLENILHFRAKSRDAPHAQAEPQNSIVYTRESIEKLFCSGAVVPVQELERLRADPDTRPLLEAIVSQVLCGRRYWATYCPCDKESRARLGEIFCEGRSGVLVAEFGLLLERERIREFHEFSTAAGNSRAYDAGAADGALEAHALFNGTRKHV